MFVAFGVVVWVAAVRDPSTSLGGFVFLGLWSVAALVGGTGLFRTRVTLSSEGVTARCFRTRVVPWDEVEAIDVSRATRMRVKLGGGGVVRPVLLTNSGGRFRLPITAGLNWPAGGAETRAT